MAFCYQIRPTTQFLSCTNFLVLTPFEPGGIFLATRLGCVSGLATRGIVCESGLVGLDPPDNRVPEFVASDPKLWDVGNRLVGVDPAFAFI
jgi:hypothetical protein